MNLNVEDGGRKHQANFPGSRKRPHELNLFSVEGYKVIMKK